MEHEHSTHGNHSMDQQGLSEGMRYIYRGDTSNAQVFTGHR